MHYFIRRLFSTLVVLVGVSLLIFILVRLMPGNIVDVMAGSEGQFTNEQRQAILEEFGLDQPLPVQYGLWVWNMLRGNFGYSFRTDQPIADILLSRLPLTIELMLCSVLFAGVIGITLGLLSSISRNIRAQVFTQVSGLLGLSVPDFWLAIVLIIIASYAFHWLPPLIFVKPWENLWQNLQQMFLPVLSLALGQAAVVMRMTRSAMLETLGEEYVKVARAKGLSQRMVFLGHALRNALIPIATVLGLEVGYLLGGVVITEQIFGLPGLGWTLLNGVYQRDYPMIQGSVMLIAVIFALTNLIVDLLYTYLDPRIRYE